MHREEWNFFTAMNRLNVATSRAMSNVIVVGIHGFLNRNVALLARCNSRMHFVDLLKWRG